MARTGAEVQQPPTHDQQYARMFELSHIYGPFIGLLLCVGLAASGFPLDYRLAGFASLVVAFWLYPLLLRKTQLYRTLSLCSLHHLTFVILWASHGYGGLVSPFLLWFAVVPLLAFLYLPPRLGLWLGLIVSLTVSMAMFIYVCVEVVPPPPVPAGMLQPMALLSIVGASGYVAMMSVYLGRVLTSRRELQQQADSHREVAAQLARLAGQTRHSSGEKLAMIGRLAKGAAGPLEDMRSSSHLVVADGKVEGDSQELQSITEAVACLQALIADTRRYAQLDGALELEPAAVDVLTLLQEAARRIRPLMGDRTEVLAQAEFSEDHSIRIDGELLVEAITYVGRHLAPGLPGRNLVLHAERMRAAEHEHVVIDLSLESGGDGAAPAVTIFDSQALKRPSSAQHAGGCGLSLALAHRICVLLGGNLLSAGAPAESIHFRMVVPVATAAGSGSNSGPDRQAA